MGAFSWYHWLIIIAVVALLFGGRGKLSSLMGDAARGIKEFKNGLKDDPHPDQGQPAGALPRQQAEKEEAHVDR